MQGFAIGVDARFKTDPRGTVELTDNHPLRSVHHKGSLLRHQGEFAHVNPFLNRGTIVIQNEGYIERSSISHPFTQALDWAIFCFAQFVMTKV